MDIVAASMHLSTSDIECVIRLLQARVEYLYTSTAKPAMHINELPNEILCHIFGLCGDVMSGLEYSCDGYMHLAKPKAVIIPYSSSLICITRVCSLWSEVARSCPRLWTLVEVPFPRGIDHIFVRLCLELSAGIPLILRLNGMMLAPGAPDPPLVFCRSLVNLVASAASRWKEVSISLGAKLDGLDPLRMLPPGSFTSLERASIQLELRNWGAHQSRPDSDIWRILMPSPSLRAVDFWDDPRRHPQLRIASMSLRNITHLGLNQIRNNELKDILAACPRVEVLQVMLGLTLAPGQPDTYALPMPPSIMLGRLRVLMLSGQRDWQPLYDCLTAPRLDRLDISGAGVQADAIEGMLDRSSTKLRMLTLRAIHPNDLDDAANLLLCGHLRELRILRVEVFKPNPMPPGRTADFDPRPFLGPQVAKCLFATEFRAAEDAQKTGAIQVMYGLQIMVQCGLEDGPTPQLWVIRSSDARHFPPSPSLRPSQFVRVNNAASIPFTVAVGLAGRTTPLPPPKEAMVPAFVPPRGAQYQPWPSEISISQLFLDVDIVEKTRGKDTWSTFCLQPHRLPYNPLHTSRNPPLVRNSHYCPQTSLTVDAMEPGASRSRTLRLIVAHWLARSNREVRDDDISATNKASNQALLRVEESKASLEVVYEHICRLIEQYWRRRARINELPVEILCLIFGFCGDAISGFNYPRDRLMHHSASSPQDSQTYSEAIFTITRVCSRWSRVARSCPTLWTRIEMHSPRWCDYRFFRLCLKLSAGLPLILRLNGALPKNRAQHPPTRYCRSVIRRVAATAPRWKEISIRLTRDFDVLDRLRTLPPGSFVSLERASIRLSMRAHDSQRPRPEIDIWHILCSSPSLRVVDFWDDPRLPSLHIASLPLRNITHLGLNKIRNNELKDILIACPRVEVLQVWLGCSVTPTQHDTYTLPMPSTLLLKRLRVLMLRGQRDWQPLYDCLTAPKLDRLDISGAGVQADSIEGMLARSSTRLRMLTLHAIHPEDLPDAASLLTRYPLCRLRILRVRVAKPDTISPGRPDFNPRPFLSRLAARKCLVTKKVKVAEDAYAALRRR
ncbi:uncharacterized protein SCHCODRAFT_02719041 [Schizophyllum commune H4-8]|nr:uncharacterized protein SCHCODRAFT_02719041 [Schizophyllum commune H4-8]KAI5885382.1 hypothetical protein SCHCODRAFT_02719041 [Schizophyllum commune H4-8]